MKRQLPVWDGAAWVDAVELPYSSRVDRGFAPIVLDKLNPIDLWQPATFGPAHMPGDDEQVGSDGLGGWAPIPSAEEERAMAHDDDFMLHGGALRIVHPGASESEPMDPEQVDRMRRRLETLRRHQLAEDFR